MPTQKTQKKPAAKKTAAKSSTTKPKPRARKKTSRTIALSHTAESFSTTPTPSIIEPQRTETHTATPRVPLLEQSLRHPEHTILILGEYYLIAILCAIVGISCLYGILVLL